LHPVLGTQLDHNILFIYYNSHDQDASINIMCHNNYVCVNCVCGIISAINDKLILSAIIEFQCDKINYVPTMSMSSCRQTISEHRRTFG
jgi:hypothetical protein